MRRITKLMSPAEAHGEYIGATLIQARAAQALATALEATWERDPDLYYEDGYQTLVDTGGEVGVAPIGTLPWVEVDNHADLDPGPGDRVPLLARMLLSPLFIDIRAGAVTGLGDLLADRRISADGHVAVAVGPGQGEQAGRGDPAGRWTTPTCSRCAAAVSTRPASCSRSCAARTTTPWSASAAAARSTSPSTPRPGWRCRWWRSPPTSRTTASPRR